MKVQLTKKDILHMREVEVINMAGENIALNKVATQSSILQNNQGWAPSKAVDGSYSGLMQTAHTLSKLL